MRSHEALTRQLSTRDLSNIQPFSSYALWKGVKIVKAHQVFFKKTQLTMQTVPLVGSLQLAMALLISPTNPMAYQWHLWHTLIENHGLRSWNPNLNEQLWSNSAICAVISADPFKKLVICSGLFEQVWNLQVWLAEYSKPMVEDLTWPRRQNLKHLLVTSWRLFFSPENWKCLITFSGGYLRARKNTNGLLGSQNTFRHNWKELGRHNFQLCPEIRRGPQHTDSVIQ